MATASHTAGHLLFEHARSQGVGASAIQALAVPPLALATPGRLPIQRMYRAWQLLQRETGDHAVGAKVARRWTFDDLGLLGFCVAAAPTMRDALDTVTAYGALVTDSGRWERLDRGQETRMIWWRSGTPAPGLAISNEVSVAVFARAVRTLFPKAKVRVELRHPRWPTRTAHAEMLGCAVEFACEHNAVVLDNRQAAAVPTSANPALWRFLCDLARREVSALVEPSLLDRARATLSTALEHEGRRLDVATLARRLGLSERTLRRRLAAAGTSSRALVREVSLAHGEACLDSEASISEIALRSGFSDGSSFARAWRRQHGAAPTARRRR